MKIFFIIITIICFNKIAYTNILFETQIYDIEFSSNNINEDKVTEIDKIKYQSLLNIFKKTLNVRSFNSININLSNDLINTFIKNITINDEKIINDTYVSKIKINFDKKKIIDYFRKNNIPYVEYHPKKFLLVIYEQDGINDNIFSNNNNFYEYYNDNFKESSFFKIPNLDINDRFILNKEDIKNKNLIKIRNFSKKYNLKETIIVHIIKKNDNSIYNLFLYSDGKILQKKLEFNNYQYDKFFKIIQNETIEMWKNLNQIQNNFVNLINCKINYFNIMELKEIKNYLQKVSLIEKIKVKSISYKNIEYDIYYFGSLSIFLKSLKLNKLKINNNKNSCIIKLK